MRCGAAECNKIVLQPRAKADIHEIWMADTRQHAAKAFDAFLEKYQAKYPAACECLAKDRDVLLAFFDFPAEHWKHLRTTNPCRGRIRNCAPTVFVSVPRTTGVRAYEVDTYGNLRSRSLVGDMLDLDHQPSNASNIARAEAELGRPLTAAERAAVRDQGTAVTVPQDWHRSLSPTYGGRNTAAQIQADALNPQAAALRDSQAMINGASAADRAAAESGAARIRQGVGGP
jgi:mutator family transposase